MVTSVTGLGRSGLSDWLIQRISAVILLVYVLYLTYFVVSTPDMSYLVWRGLFAQTWMKIFSLLALFSLCAHAWIGMWTISTDYITSRLLGNAAGRIRLIFQLGCILILFVYFVWCIQILWSN